MQNPYVLVGYRIIDLVKSITKVCEEYAHIPQAQSSIKAVERLAELALDDADSRIRYSNFLMEKESTDNRTEHLQTMKDIQKSQVILYNWLYDGSQIISEAKQSIDLLLLEKSPVLLKDSALQQITISYTDVLYVQLLQHLLKEYVNCEDKETPYSKEATNTYIKKVEEYVASIVKQIQSQEEVIEHKAKQSLGVSNSLTDPETLSNDDYIEQIRKAREELLKL